VVILIGGASHTGKTLLAQKLMEKYHWPYVSIDHLKMGLIRSGNTALSVYEDDALTQYLWPIVREMVKTAVENRQNLIVEGCYLPFDWQKDFEEAYLKHIRFCCLVMTRDYIETHFAEIQACASVIEDRGADPDLDVQTLLRDNERNLAACREYGCAHILIDESYPESMEAHPVFAVEPKNQLKLHGYTQEDCAQLAQLFYDTVHSVNAADYTPAQLDAWADGNADLEKWHISLSAHHTVVARMDGRIVGFGDMDDTGYLDRLYVHRDCQRRGIATAICDRLESLVPGAEYTTHASITARPFFEKRGYVVLKEQQVRRGDVWLTNFVMKKHPKCP